MSDHARFSPSAAYRWMNCPGSVLAIESAVVQDRSSPQAERGTWLHDVAAKALAGENHSLTGEDAEIVDSYVSYVRTIMGDGKNKKMLIEHKVSLTDEIWGTADCIIIEPYVMHIIDLKTGSQKVEANGNPQLMIYAAAALNEFNVLPSPISHPHPPVDVVMHIVQSSIGWTESVTVSADRLNAYGKTVIAAANRASAPGAPFQPSDKNCQFCPIADRCKARSDFNLAIAVRDFALADPATISEFDLQAILPHLDQIESWVSSVRKYAISTMLGGGKIKGYKLVQTGGARKWADPVAAISAMIEAGIPPESSCKTTPIGIGDAEKLLGKSHPVFKLHTVKSDFRPFLAPMDDKRPEWVTNAAGEFPAIES